MLGSLLLRSRLKPLATRTGSNYIPSLDLRSSKLSRTRLSAKMISTPLQGSIDFPIFFEEKVPTVSTNYPTLGHTPF